MSAANGHANGDEHPAKKQKQEGGTLHGSHNVVLVLDYGSQYTQLICRRIREIGLFSMMFPGDASMVRAAHTPAPGTPPGGMQTSTCARAAAPLSLYAALQPLLMRLNELLVNIFDLRPLASTLTHPQERIAGVSPKVVILSGGPNSVHLEGSPRVPDQFWSYTQEHSIPVLGICYGMQLIVHTMGGEVKPAEHGGEYGRMPIMIQPGSTLFSAQVDLPSPNVWMSHGDEAVRLPEGFSVVAKSQQVGVRAKEGHGGERSGRAAGRGACCVCAGGEAALLQALPSNHEPFSLPPLPPSFNMHMHMHRARSWRSRTPRAASLGCSITQRSCTQR